MIASCIFKSKQKTRLISIVGAGGKTSATFYLANEFKKLGHKVLVTNTTRMYPPDDNQYDYIISATSHQATIDELFLYEQLSHIKDEPSISFAYSHSIEQHGVSKVSGLSCELIQQIKQAQLFSVIIVEADGAHTLPLKAPAAHEPCMPNQTDIVIAVCSSELFNQALQAEQIHRWDEFRQVTDCQVGDKLTIEILSKLITAPQGLFKSAPRHATRIWLLNKTDICPELALLKQQISQLSLSALALSEIWLTQFKPQTQITLYNSNGLITD